MVNNTSIESDTSINLGDKQNEAEEMSFSPVVGHVMNRFYAAERSRRVTEQRWRKAWINFRGLYRDNVKFTSTEKSQAFIKITKTKVVAAAGQIFDIVYSDGKMPINIVASPVPEGIAEEAHVDMESLSGAEQTLGADAGFIGDGNDEETGGGMMARVAEIARSAYHSLPFVEGPAAKGEPEISPAEMAARAMNKEIHDQLEEAGAAEHVVQAIYESALLGSGCIKGPFKKVKEYPNWEMNEETNELEYKPVKKLIPELEYVSVWGIYPDPRARSVEEAEYVIQRHRMTNFELSELKNKQHFRNDVIDELLVEPVTVLKEEWEDTIREDSTTEHDDRHVVYEYWGNINPKMFGEEFEKTLPDSLANEDTIQVNIWVSAGKIIRMSINPFLPKRIPYHITHFELDLYNFFGIGVAENMEDAQTLTNGFWRLAIDNAVLSGNMIFEVDEMNLVPGQDLRVHPGKMFRRRAGAPGQALFSHSFKSTANENIAMLDKAMALADTSTGIPAVSHGQPAGTVGRTALGMSMMMGAASLNVKTVIRNLDMQLFKPLGDALFAWNMQFNEKEEIKGDLSVQAQATNNLLQKEVKSQRLLQFLQITSANPVTAPITNAEAIIKELAITMDLDPEEVINSPAKQEALQALFANMNQGGSNGTNIANGENGPVSAQDQTGGGGGQAGVGTPIAPGEEQSNQPQPPL